jgi:hypothetical protein
MQIVFQMILVIFRFEKSLFSKFWDVFSYNFEQMDKMSPVGLITLMLCVLLKMGGYWVREETSMCLQCSFHHQISFPFI